MLAVVTAAVDEQSRIRAESLARELQLPLVSSDELSPERFELVLQVGKRGLELAEVGRGRGRPVRVDFARGPMGYRLRTAGVGRQLIARAVGLRGKALTVVDATAGLGRDAFLLARLGCSVVAVERSTVVGALLRDGLARALAETRYELNTIAKRIRLLIADARNVLRKMPDGDAPDVVYLDPMYPTRKKSALGKKEMRIFRLLVGDDPDALDLLEVARGVARQRVVVKRQRYAPALAPGRAFEYLGRTVRYDVYQPISRF